MAPPDRPDGRAGPREGTTHALYAILWDALTELMGGAATATLVRRAAQRAATRAPDLEGVTIERDRFVYRYVVPASWDLAPEPRDAARAFDELVTQLRPLLVELTGDVVVRRLRRTPGLERCGHLLDGDV